MALNELPMVNDYSFGIIPLRYSQQQWHVLLVQHQAGHWAFPKGHADAGESPQQAAERELYEETGLKVKKYLSQEDLIERYFFKVRQQRICKLVRYFIALVEGQVVIQEAEIQASRWLPLSEASQHVTFKEGKLLCQQVEELATFFSIPA
ncbi:bis(5'-nucleosyl)-tetraphosphatase [Candidatus Protochlamydia phocaeensis]|uniref:bis(5'-nucleosyl)-tetraphosphatase n=1 Tax=Candidatus Protochlamydia phocaeensis TaxID=1414722 RepID=UPI000A3E4C3E|nr:NUDIX domain-containing protein [Candidatus Protochlamydia phocaeensis]